MYKGLDIVTNKVTPEEMSQVKHHVIDFLDPLTACTVHDFRNKVSSAILSTMVGQTVVPFGEKKE